MIFKRKCYIFISDIKDIFSVQKWFEMSRQTGASGHDDSNLTCLYDHIPVSWRGLFKALTVKERQLQEAELWFRDEKCSRYGKPLEWNDLMYGLTTQEPVYQADTLKL